VVTYKKKGEMIKMKSKCKECMYDAPYKWCCKEVCGEIEFCRDCEAKCRGTIKMCLKEGNGSARKSN
jgi:hypothetical protein